jgi:hypothetical protein
VGLELRQDHPADFGVVVNGDPRELHPIVRDELYRLGREAIANCFQHANAERCETEINYDRTEPRIGAETIGSIPRVILVRHQTGLASRTLQIGPSVYRAASIRMTAGTLLSVTHTWESGGCLPIIGATIPATPPRWTLTSYITAL